MKKKRLLEIIEIQASYISNYIDTFENKDDLINQLDKLKNTRNTTYPNYKIESNESCISFINSLDENSFKLFTDSFIKKINKKNFEKECFNKLKELIKGYDIYIIDFAVYSENYFGIKVEIMEHVYLFDSKGTIEKLANSLIKEHDKLSECDILCPYCDAEVKLNQTLCDCGVNIIHESYDDISDLVKESGGKEVIKRNGYKVWFLDELSMENYQYISNDPDKYYNNKFKEYIKNKKYEHINSDSITDTNYELNGIKFTITRSDYFKFITEICLRYCDWVRNGKLYDINHDNDDYDHSGEIELISSGNMYKNITTFENVYEWVFECYDGNKTPTYCSGMGFSYDTYYDRIRYDISFESIVYEKMNITQDDEIYDELISGDETFEIGCEIESVVFEYLEEMTTIQCWNDYSEYK